MRTFGLFVRQMISRSSVTPRLVHSALIVNDRSETLDNEATHNQDDANKNTSRTTRTKMESVDPEEYLVTRVEIAGTKKRHDCS